MQPAVDSKFTKNSVFQRVLKEGLAIQDRFSAEPVYARTGRGQLKPAGVEELREIKAKENVRQKAGG